MPPNPFGLEYTGSNILIEYTNLHPNSLYTRYTDPLPRLEIGNRYAAAAAAGGDPAGAATAAVNSAIASSMFAGGQAIGAVTTAFSMFGFTLFGVALWQQKSFNPILACLIAVTGIYTLLMCLIDYESQLIAIGYLGITASFVWLGVSLFTKKN